MLAHIPMCSSAPGASSQGVQRLLASPASARARTCKRGDHGRSDQDPALAPRALGDQADQPRVAHVDVDGLFAVGSNGEQRSERKTCAIVKAKVAGGEASEDM